jgi:hypothetical protein
MIYAFFTLTCCIIAYNFIRYYFPPKNKIIDSCYQYILNERSRYKHTYEFLPRNLEKRFYREVRGVTKYNRRQIAEAVIQKLIDNNIVELVPDICVDRYRAIYVEQKNNSSTIRRDESNS